MKELIRRWQLRQQLYESLAIKHKGDIHKVRKYTYKATATRDCWKELLKHTKQNKTNMKIREGQYYIHQKSGGKYVIEKINFQVKIDGVWHNAVLYKSEVQNRCWCRTVEEFQKKFKLI